MTKLTLEQQELLFANDCKLINLRYEYHGYTGTEKWAIVTELAEEELWVKYPDVIRRYTPFILLSMAQGEVITEYQNYEARERMRRLLFGHAFDINDGEFEVHHPELAVDTDPIEEIMLKDNIKRLREVLLLQTTFRFLRRTEMWACRKSVPCSGYRFLRLWWKPHGISELHGLSHIFHHSQT